MESIEAIYEHGVFRPLVPLVLPENSRVQIQIVNGNSPQEPAREDVENDDMEEIYKILDKRYSSGHTDTAARHNEHQL